MRTIAAAAFLGALFATACASAAKEEAIAREETNTPRLSWPLGTYELVSFNGQSLPVELSDGRILSSGSLTMFEGIRGAWGLSRSPGVEFGMILNYPVPFGRFVLRPRGTVWAEQDPVEGARNPLHFEALGRGDVDGSYVFRGFDRFPLEWGNREYASGTLFGNELRVGAGEKFLVFMRR
jgi:hypothetical protein